MAKNEITPRQVIKASGGNVSVFNTGTRQVAVAIRMHDSKSHDVGRPLRAVKFLPGNNDIDQDDWEKCKKHDTVKAWLSSVDQLDANGNLARSKVLIEGKVDPRFESTSTVLADRMASAQRALSQIAS